MKNIYKTETFGRNVKRRDYSKTINNLPVTDLTEIQKKSFKKFLNTGIVEVFENIFPIISTNGRIKIEFLAQTLRIEIPTDEYKGIKEAKIKGKTYSAKIYASLRQIDQKTGEVKEQEVFFGEIPLMTSGASFIVNGSEKVIVSQLLRAPGTYFGLNVRTSRTGLYNRLEIIPHLGTWIEMYHKVDNTNVVDNVKVSIDKNKSVSLSIFLRAFGISKDTIVDIFGNLPLIQETIKKDNKPTEEDALNYIHGIVRKGDRITNESRSSLFLNLFFNKRRYNLSKTGRFMINRKLSVIDRIENTILAKNLKSKNGKIIYKAGITITNKMANDIHDKFVDGTLPLTNIKGINHTVYGSLVEPKNEKEKISNYQKTLKTKIKVAFLEVFPSKKWKNEKKEPIKVIGNDINGDEKHLVLPDLIAAVSYYFNISCGLGYEDDPDSLTNKRVVSIGELLKNQLQIALTKLEKNAKERISAKEIEKITPKNITNNKSIYDQFKTFFNTSQLSQFMDQMNPLAELSNKRRLTSLGPGGLNRETASHEVRDVHTTHYGRICPIETPEGQNIGLILNFANYARINEYGFIETPYFEVKNKKVSDKPKYLTASEEVGKYFAQSNLTINKDKIIQNPEIIARFNGEYLTVTPEEINYIDVSSKQMTSIASSAIPFLENDDANRALMGANMQRQAIPLIKSESPIVGTGIESEIAKFAASNLKAENDGIVKYVDSEIIKIKHDKKEKTYKLRIFERSNQGSMISQKPIVKINDKVKMNDVITDGPSFENGEMALGKNVVVGFSTWNGYNFEDAIILSEKLVKNDTYTSIHIEEKIVEFRKQKLGDDILTNEIPNVSKFSIRNLDEDGIVIVGSEVQAGDILVGRVSPKGEDNPTPEEKLIAAIFSKRSNNTKDTSLKVAYGHGGTVIDVQILSRDTGDKLQDDVSMIIKILICQKRKIKVGDKMAGRHGNKGVISKVMPIEDMPHLKDGTPIDILLNPQGVPSRMNIGQVLELHLGLAGKKLGVKFVTPVFDGIKIEDINSSLSEANLPKDGKFDLYDPISGEKFDQKVSVGIMYVLKLSHMIDDKMHARSIGPYSLITQQPLGGKSQNGGQRFGEMETWAIEAYGATNVLQELLTYKSDNIDGRNKVYNALINGAPLPQPGTPESFNVLAYELRGLCMKLAVGIDEQKNNSDVKEQSRKFNTINENEIINVSLSLATKDDVENWSHGEVKKPETINYKSFKPERTGLFDELIFGPQVDYKCPICSTKYKRSNDGQKCEKSDECKIFQPSILSSSTKRSRMGHIKLTSPVVHFWFMQIDHSILTKLLGLKAEGVKKAHSRTDIQNIVYFKSHIVLESGGIKALPKNEIINIKTAAITYRNALREIIKKYKVDSDAYKEINQAIQDLEESANSKIGKDYGMDFYELNDIIQAYSKVKIGTGAKAIEYLLENFEIKKEATNIKKQITKINKELESGKTTTTKIQQRSKLYKRLEVINGFIKSGQDLKSILIYNLPIIPADLRPLVQIEGGRHSTTDVNELYRRIIIRNNRLKNWRDVDAPILIVQNELRMIQEAVDALIDNARKKPSPVVSKNNRPLKSISDSLSGKKGRFRQNLLGKRVDYSGRSVIIVGPSLKMHQAGIPRGMAAKLFEPWIIRELIKAEKAQSIKYAKKMIEEQNKEIWPFVEKAIKGKVVLLNRAPTLHRLSIQAFEPVLIRGKAIRLHPLVTSAFNADFDGDQMAVHIPISKKAILEAKELMFANKNILGPKDGEPIINPSQDMILGIYYLTKEKAGVKGEGMIFNNYNDLIKAFDRKTVSLHSRVAMTISGVNKRYLLSEKGYIISTVGKFIFNSSFPSNFPFIFDDSKKTLNKNYVDYIVKPNTNIIEHIKKMKINKALRKKDIARIVRAVFDEYVAIVPKEDIAKIISNLNSSNLNKIFDKVSKLTNNKNQPIKKSHVPLLEKFITKSFNEMNKYIKLNNSDVERTLEINERIELLEKVWFKYNNVVAKALDNIKELGFKYSMLSGISISINDIMQSSKTKEHIDNGNKYASQLKQMFNNGVITDDERYRLIVNKWTNIKNLIQEELNDLSSKNKDNPIFTMMDSGARGNIANFVQLAGLRGLMSNNKKNRKDLAKNDIIVRSTIEVPVKSSFLKGLTAFEFYSTTPGARKGLTDTALNTANAGYLTRRLVDVAQNIVVKENDCGADKGFIIKDIIDTKTKTIIVPLKQRMQGRFAAVTIKNKNQEIIVNANELITNDIAEKIIDEKINRMEIRSVLGCQTSNGVCIMCYGKDLATNDLVQIGEPVGIVAAQSIGEPGTQLTMRTFHTGGVAGVEDITGGFDRLKQLIDATKLPWEKPAIISKSIGKVESILKSDTNNNMSIIKIISKDKDKTEYTFKYETSRRLRVKKGDDVFPGKKLVEGPIILNELLEIAGVISVQNYLLKEIQRLYRMQGISIADKYVEIIIRQMFSKVLIQTIGDSQFFAGSLVDINKYMEINGKLIAKGKKPTYGNIVIKGAKQIPLLSNSFLAAASYQETAKTLVHSSLSGRVDELTGLKENIILGRKIPAGTGTNYEPKGKFDIKNPRSFFTK